jgi:hypothetical protein
MRQSKITSSRRASEIRPTGARVCRQPRRRRGEEDLAAELRGGVVLPVAVAELVVVALDGADDEEGDRVGHEEEADEGAQPGARGAKGRSGSVRAERGRDVGERREDGGLVGGRFCAGAGKDAPDGKWGGVG